MPRLLFFLISIALLSGCTTVNQRAERREQTARMVEQAVSQRRLMVTIRSMQTQRYGSHQVSSDFYLKLRGDTLDSYLPFFGRAYGVSPVTPSQGLHFVSPVLQMEESKRKNNVTRLEMHVRSQEDSYVYRLDIYPNAQVYISVHGQERDHISFDGELDL